MPAATFDACKLFVSNKNETGRKKKENEENLKKNNQGEKRD